LPQEDIAPKDLDMFEEYWIGQFPNLLNRQTVKSIPPLQRLAGPMKAGSSKCVPTQLSA